MNNYEMIDLKQIVSNTSQSRGMGVLPNLRAKGWEVFKSLNNPPIWSMLLSDEESSRKAILDLIEKNEYEIVDQATNIKVNGQIQPIGVIKILNAGPADFATEATYDVVYGMRRAICIAYLACKFYPNRPQVEAKVLEPGLSVVDLKLLALSENDTRRDESPIDRAITYQWLKEQGLTEAQIGEKTNQSELTIKNYISLLSPLLEDKKYEIHSKALSVDRALKLLNLRKENPTAQEPRASTRDSNRYRLPGVKGIQKIYEAKKRPKSISLEEWDLWTHPMVRRFLAFKLGFRYTEYKGGTEEKKPEKKVDTPTEPATINNVPKVLKIKKSTCQDLMISLGKSDARTWDDLKLKSRLEGISSILEPNQKAETEGLQKLLDKLLECEKQGIKIKFLDSN